MIKVFELKNNLDQKTIGSILNEWSQHQNKIFHLKSNIPKDQVRNFYENVGISIGKLHYLRRIFCVLGYLYYRIIGKIKYIQYFFI